MGELLPRACVTSEIPIKNICSKKSTSAPSPNSPGSGGLCGGGGRERIKGGRDGAAVPAKLAGVGVREAPHDQWGELETPGSHAGGWDAAAGAAVLRCGSAGLRRAPGGMRGAGEGGCEEGGRGLQ